jgi:hypothetical protein
VVVNRADLPIQAGVERHLASVEALIPRRPAWRVTGDHDIRPAPVQMVAGRAFRGETRSDRRLGVLLAVGAVLVITLAYGLAGGGLPIHAPATPLSSPTASPTASAVATAEPTEPGWLRPVVEPRLIIPVRPKTAWTVVDDGVPYLDLVYFLDDVGSAGYNVGLAIFEPRGVYDPLVETRKLPIPADLIGWIHDHPDLEAGEPVALTVAGFPATAIDVTVTYRAGGPKGQTAQFIDDGVGSWNLEFPSKKRIVLVELPDRPMLIVFGSRPEFFDAGIGQFESELRSMQFEGRGASP